MKTILGCMVLMVSAVGGNPVADCLPGLEVSGSAQALYWEPCNQELGYGLISSDSTSAPSQSFDALYVDPEYGWGFRLAADASLDRGCNAAELEWARFRDTTKILQSAGDRNLLIFPTERVVDAIFASQKTLYNSVSLKLRHRFCGNCHTYFYAYIGGCQLNLRLEHFDQSQDIGVPESFDHRTKYSGGGLQGGVGGRADVWCGLGLKFQAGFIGLMGTRGYSVQYVDFIPNEIKRFIRGDTQVCASGTEAKFAIYYVYRGSCWCASAEVGYEVRHYADVLLFPAELPSVNGTAFSNPNSFGVAGLYFGASVGF